MANKGAGNPVDRLSPRKAKYVAGVMKGKSKKQAATDAGYAESTAENARAKIEDKDVLAAFAHIIQKACPADKLAQRIAEGLDATETKFFQKDGVVIETRDVIAWDERRQYCELAVKFGNYHVDKKALELTVQTIADLSSEQLTALSARLEREFVEQQGRGNN
jgi:phage terminase small subunit